MNARRILVTATAAAAIAVTVSGCDQIATVRDDGSIRAAGGGEIVYVAENQGGFDADPGDVVIVVMYLDGNDVIGRCHDMGATLSWSNGIAYCGAAPHGPDDRRGIDF